MLFQYFSALGIREVSISWLKLPESAWQGRRCRGPSTQHPSTRSARWGPRPPHSFLAWGSLRVTQGGGKLWLAALSLRTMTIFVINSGRRNGIVSRFG